MKMILKIIWLVATLALSFLSAQILKNGFPDGEGDPVQFRNGIKFIWIQVGFFSALTSFMWIALFSSKMKAALISIPIWLIVSTAYTTHDLAMRCKIINAIDLIDEKRNWQPIHCASLMDGGSILLGLINDGGEIVYLQAWPDDEGEKQRISIELHYNDPYGVFVDEGSELENKLVGILNNLHHGAHQSDFSSLVDEFKTVLSNRFSHVTGK